MGENTSVKRTIEELNQRQEEWIQLNNEYEKYKDILAEKKEQSNDQELEQ